MRTKVALLVLVAGGALGGASAASAAQKAATLCVGAQPGCYATLQAAVDAANDGDTIAVGRGTFAGGVTIAKNLTLAGSGVGQTIIKGGGPVLTIGSFLGADDFTVSIRGVTITGGLNESQPDTAVTFGGGIWIPVAEDQGAGATVSIANSAITNNRVETSSDIAPGGFCGPLACGFGDGGGIDNGGNLTIANSTITGNQVGPGMASGNGSGGILNRFQATLVLSHSFVTGNQVVSDAPNGRGANTGGVSSDGKLTIDTSVISGNNVQLRETFDGNFDEGAFAGGVQISGFPGSTGTITNSAISGNHVTATSTVNDTGAFAGGILAEGTMTLSGSSVDRNGITVNAPGNAFADGGGIEVDGTAAITKTLIVANTVAAVGTASGAFVQGGGLANVGTTTLQQTLVLGNSVFASGPTGVAQGGGIWNATFNPGDPLPSLTLVNSAVTGNSVKASGGITPQGGGIFSIVPVTLTRTLVVGNSPDQCEGC
jgi:hypothetical protein